MNIELNETRRRLIAMLQRDGRASLVKLSSKLGISHVAVKKNLESIVKSGVVKVGALINPKALGLRLILLLLECRDYKCQGEILWRFSECPRMVFLSPTIGGYNLMTVMVAENIDVLESIITVCAIRVHKCVRRNELIVLGDPIYPTHLPIRLVEDRDRGNTPCGLNCCECKRYLEGKCLGCPATQCYRGSLAI